MRRAEVGSRVERWIRADVVYIRIGTREGPDESLSFSTDGKLKIRGEKAAETKQRCFIPSFQTFQTFISAN